MGGDYKTINDTTQDFTIRKRHDVRTNKYDARIGKMTEEVKGKGFWNSKKKGKHSGSWEESGLSGKSS